MRHTGLLRIYAIGSVYALILLAVAFVVFSRLGDRALWGDEAETTTLAVNITKYGSYAGISRVRKGEIRATKAF